MASPTKAEAPGRPDMPAEEEELEGLRLVQRCTDSTKLDAERRKLDGFQSPTNEESSTTSRHPHSRRPRRRRYDTGSAEEEKATVDSDTAEQKEEDELDIAKLVQMRLQALPDIDATEEEEEEEKGNKTGPRGAPLPGAYSDAPGVDPQRRDDARFSLIGVVPAARRMPSDILSSTKSSRSQASLSIANLVTEADERDLPKAQDLDEDSVHQRDRARQQWMKKMLLVFLLVLLIIVLLAALVPRSTTKSDTLPSHAPSRSPSQSPSYYDGYALSLFWNDTLDALVDPNSTQSKAFRWLREERDYSPNLAPERILQRFALASLYFATNGPNWIYNTHWLDHTTHECDWFLKPEFGMNPTIKGIYEGFLQEFYVSRDESCDESGLYRHLWLDQNNLVGSLPEELFHLTTLKTLSTGLNQLKGTISSRLGTLTDLEGLLLFGQEKAGSIPTEIELLSKLKVILLNHNEHEGSVPTEIWGLSKLDTLILGQNFRLKGTIPSEIGSMPDLRWFIVNGCDFSGTLPTEIGRAKALEWIDISDNTISGNIPTELALLSNITLLPLGGNSLTGTIHSELGLFAGLQLLDLGSNYLTGSIPSELGLLTRLVFTLNLKENHSLQKTIPSQLGLLADLRELSINGNNITGFITTQLGQMSSLISLDIASNSLVGPIPPSLANLHRSLYALNVGGNLGLTGTVPNSLCNLLGSCEEHALLACPSHHGLTLDCTQLLCGCNCSCAA